MQQPVLDCTKARSLVARGAQLVDVREPHEFHHSPIPGAINIPLASIPHAVGELLTDRPILVYCRTGRRSGIAKQLLEARGFSSVHNIVSADHYQRCA